MEDLDVIRIPGSRPIYKPKAERQTREQNWDERFVLGRIPVYDAFKDKHCLGYLMTAGKKKKVLMTPGKIRKARSPSNSFMPKAGRTLSVKGLQPTVQKPVLAGNVLRQLRENLQELWVLDHIPDELSAPVLQAVDVGSLRERAQALAKEIEDTQGKKSVLQSLTKALYNREQAILQVHTLIDDFSTAQHKGQYTAQAKNVLTHMRMMTLHTVECIGTYKDYVSALCFGERTAGKVPVMFQGQNYLLKMKSDLLFLTTSPLASIFDFSEKSDPFLLYPSKLRKKTREELPLPITLMSRIKAAEKVMLEEILTHRNESRERGAAEHRSKRGETTPQKQAPTTMMHADVQALVLPTDPFIHHSAQDSSINPSSTNRLPTPSSFPVQSSRPLSRAKIAPLGVEKDSVLSLLKTSEIPVSPSKSETDDFQSAGNSLKADFSKEIQQTDAGRSLLSEESYVPEAQSRREEAVPETPAEVMGIEEIKGTKTDVNPTLEDLQSPASIPQPLDPLLSPLPSDLDLASFHMTNFQLESELEDYLKTIPINIKETFWNEDAFSMILKQNYPAWIQVMKAGKRMGVFSISIDTLNTNVKRVFIHHLSAQSIPDLSQVLDICLLHVWETLGCDEVRISLNYRDKDGKMEADKEVKSVIAARKFRWKNLTNTGDGRRVIIMALTRPAEIQAKTVPEEFFRETLMIKYAAAVQIKDADQNSVEEQPSHSASYTGLVACLKDFGLSLGVSSHSSETRAKSVFEKLAKTFTFPTFRTVKSGDVDQALEVIRTQEIDLEGLEKDQLTSATCLAIGLRWASFDTSPLEVSGVTYHYLRIIDIELNTAELDTGLQVYLLPSDDPQFNLLILTKKDGIDEENDPWECASQTLRKLTEKEAVFVQTANEIWIPGFQVRKGSTQVQEMIGLEIEEIGQVSNAIETLAMSLQAPTHVLGNVLFKPSASAIVLTKSFIIGKMYAAVLNTKLDDLAPIPYLAQIVHMEDFTVYD